MWYEMRSSRVMRVPACVAVWVAAGAIALAATRWASHTGARWREVPLGEQVVLLVPRGAGVGGWCLTTLGGEREGSYSDCRGGGPVASEGPIIMEITRPSIYVVGANLVGKKGPTRVALVLTTAQVAAVSYEGYGRIATHASVLLPDGMRGAVLELRGRAGELPAPFGHVKLVAWSKSGRRITGTFGTSPPLAFGVPSHSWSPGMSEPRGVCGINVRGLDEASFREGAVMTTVRPRGYVRGREFVDCADANYGLGENGVARANVLLDAAHPGTTPASLPGMRALPGHPGIFAGPGGESTELARRIPGAWLLVTEGDDLAQRLALLEHLRAGVYLQGGQPSGVE
jgi:hypothetical protein